jgi:hypothetical protein
VCCLVQKNHWTLLLWGLRWTSHHSYIATLHRDDQWISRPPSLHHTITCGVNKMVLRPTRQWLARVRFVYYFRSWWFLVSVTWRAVASPFAGTNSTLIFFCEVIWKVKFTADALQTSIHSNKPYETKSSTVQKKHLDKLRATSHLARTSVFNKMVATYNTMYTKREPM